MGGWKGVGDPGPNGKGGKAVWVEYQWAPDYDKGKGKGDYDKGKGKGKY